MHFLDIDVDIAVGAFLKLLLQLVDLGAFASDDDSRARRLDNDAQLISGALYFDRADSGRLELILQLILQPHILEQQLVVVPLDKPARLPGLGVAEAKSVRMNFLSHRYSCQILRFAQDVRCGLRRPQKADYFFATAFFFAAEFFLAVGFLAGALVGCSLTVLASAAPFLPRSASSISICAMRRT